MSEKRTNCDKCYSKITNGKCDCGFWYDYKEYPPLMRALEKAIEAYDFHCDQNNTISPMTGDHHSGTCIILFKGNIDDCDALKELLEQRNKT